MLRGERIMEGRGGGKRGIVEGRKDDEGRGDREERGERMMEGRGKIKSRRRGGTGWGGGSGETGVPRSYSMHSIL